jgi:hypothetical protein
MLSALAVGVTLAGSSGPANAQSLTGKWVFQGSRGISYLEIFPGEKHAIGPMRGSFRHSIVLDDGRVIEGTGTYTFRYIVPNRGWLTLTFSDGHVTTEHEHAVGANVLSLRHHGVIRNYVRQ